MIATSTDEDGSAAGAYPIADPEGATHEQTSLSGLLTEPPAIRAMVGELQSLVGRLAELAGHEDRALREPIAAGYANWQSTSMPDADDFQTAKARVIAHFERTYLAELLERTGGNVSAAARYANKERRALGKLLKKHGIVPRRPDPRPHQQAPAHADAAGYHQG